VANPFSSQHATSPSITCRSLRADSRLQARGTDRVADWAEPGTSFSVGLEYWERRGGKCSPQSCSPSWFNACSERLGDRTALPPMRGCDEACPQAPASAAAVWAGCPLMRRLRTRRNLRTRTRSPTAEVASTDTGRAPFPIPRWP
jgi:hypothetical protein